MSTEPELTQKTLFEDSGKPAKPVDHDGLHKALRNFKEFGTKSVVTRTLAQGRAVPTYVNEFWTAKQRAAGRLHEVSYRACFKPQLPRFFIDRLTKPGDVVYDPFLGRGTTMVEAALLGRVPVGCDINPLSARLTLPRLAPPTVEAVAERLEAIPFAFDGEAPEDLLVFYHPETLAEICALRAYLIERRATGAMDHVDQWIEMVALNRLTGHSKGFFSVYTMPPNQAVGLQAQQKINARRKQVPERRDVPALVLRKTKTLLSDTDAEQRAALAAAESGRVLIEDAAATAAIASESVRLVVTSPPFLDVVKYKDDNWLRCWFADIDAEAVPMQLHRKVEDWQAAMTKVFAELARVLRPGGYVAFEVGEVRGGSVRLDEVVIPCGWATGLEPQLVLVNDQKFTKTANCWGVGNNEKGTNTNRVVVFRKG